MLFVQLQNRVKCSEGLTAFPSFWSCWLTVRLLILSVHLKITNIQQYTKSVNVYICSKKLSISENDNVTDGIDLVPTL